MVSWKSKYLEMKLKYINSKQKAGVRRRQQHRLVPQPIDEVPQHIDEVITYIKDIEMYDESNLHELHELHDYILNIVHNEFLQVLLQEIIIDENTVNINFIKENKYLVLFIFYMEKFKVFEILYPLNDQEINTINDTVLQHQTELLNKNAEEFLKILKKTIDTLITQRECGMKSNTSSIIGDNILTAKRAFFNAMGV